LLKTLLRRFLDNALEAQPAREEKK
jgi:hypothetical protein